MSSASPFFAGVVSLAITYWAHSTLLLTACWCLQATGRLRSQYLAARCWKTAAAVGLATAPLQVLIGSQWHIQVSMPAEQHLAPSSTRELPTQQSTESQRSSAAATMTGEDANPVAKAIDSLSVSQPTEDTAAGPPVAVPISQSAGGPPPFKEVATDFAPYISTWPGRLPLVVPMSGTIILCIAVVGFGLFGWQAARFRQQIARLRPVTDGRLRSALDRLCRTNGIDRPVQLLLSDKHTEPIAVGLTRWRIIVPRNISERLQDDERDALLAHELAHLIRGDLWWLWFGRALSMCFPFQPLNALARKKWQRSAEYLCDDWATAAGVEALSLARCLTLVAESSLQVQQRQMGLAVVGARSAIVSRVRRLVDDRTNDIWTNPRRRAILHGGTFLLIPILICMTPQVGVSVDQPVALERANTTADADAGPEAAPLDGPTAWATMTVELQKLESDLSRVEAAVLKSAMPPQATELALKLRAHVTSLRHQRESIRSHFRKGV